MSNAIPKDEDELNRCLHFIIKAAKAHYSGQSPCISPGDAKWAATLPDLIKTREERLQLEAHLEELEGAIGMAGKTMLGDKTIIDSSTFEGGLPDMIDADILRTRLKSLQSQLDKLQKGDSQ